MKKTTAILHAGRDPAAFQGAVNPPVYRVSTVVHDSVAALDASNAAPFAAMSYGRYGTPTSFAFEEAMAELEDGHYCIATSSGLTAITGTLLALLKAGDHLLVADTVYYPTRKFCERALARLGIETSFYDPLIGAAIADLIRPNTRLVYVESPGSLTFEVQDVPAIAAAAHAHGALVVADNTWGVLNFQPFRHGVDVSIQSCTKYVGGHSDAMLGAIVTDDNRLWLKLKRSIVTYGNHPGSEEVYLGLRGLRTLVPRLRQHARSALTLARWLQDRPEVERVLYPALESDPGHALWRRDFTGACGLFGVIFKPYPKPRLDAMLDGFTQFKLGYSWGGFESLALPAGPDSVVRTATRWDPPGPLVRFHAGLEDIDDLKDDLDRGLRRLAEGP
jgi:cystathionine beta-lyase